MIELAGITWNHTRGYLPMVATAQRFEELHPEISVQWQRRSLQQFADAPVEELAARFDLLVVDHPSIGEAALRGVFLPLEAHLPPEFLEDQARQSVGLSHASYEWEGRQWALAIDAATPVSGWRPDLLERAGASPPASWEELVELAGRGLVAVPAFPIDSLMHFYMLCIALGDEPFRQDCLASPETGAKALELLRSLVARCASECLARNPIRTWEALAAGAAAYCPFAYGYSNYARSGYAAHPLRFGPLVTLHGLRLRSTLGGAGLAVSARTKHPAQALEYARFVAAGECQRGLYFDSGGQPGHRSAWVDPEVNRRSNSFFHDTLGTLDEAWMRPRFPGYITFQEKAAPVVHRYLEQGGSEAGVLAALDRLLEHSRQPQ